MKHTSVVFAIAVALLPGALVPLRAVAAVDPFDISARSPKELGRVAILPFVDISGERQEDQGEYRDTALDEVEERFRKHAIEYVKRDEMKAALDTLKLDVNDDEDRTKAKLKAVADALRARYVVTGILHEANSGLKRRGFLGGEGKAGQAKVQFHVFDAQSERYVSEMELTASSTARAKAFSSGWVSRANKLRVKAIRDATKKAMAAFLKPFPKVHDDDPGEPAEGAQVAEK